MRVLVDIDSALVSQAPGGRRHSIPEAIEKAKVIAENHALLLWSKLGLKYARAFAKDNGLTARCIQKPDQLISRL